MLSSEQLEAIRQLGSSAAANAIETFDVRLRNEGFSDGSVRCLFPSRPPVIGYAVPARVRFTGPPAAGHTYYDRTDWWNYVLTIPEPRLVVLQDCDPQPGHGAFLGELHGNILRALGCVGAITNGAFRDLPELEALGLALFAGNVVPSHSYAHLVEFGCMAEVGGLRVSEGVLILGDRHGLVTIPQQIAARIPAAADKLRRQRKPVIDLCQSREFSVERLRELVKGLG